MLPRALQDTSASAAAESLQLWRHFASADAAAAAGSEELAIVAIGDDADTSLALMNAVHGTAIVCKADRFKS